MVCGVWCGVCGVCGVVWCVSDLVACDEAVEDVAEEQIEPVRHDAELEADARQHLVVTLDQIDARPLES